MTRRAPTRPKSRAGVSLRRMPVDAADIGATDEENAAVEIEEIGPLHPDHVPPAKAGRPSDGRRLLALSAAGLLCALGAAAGVGKALSEAGKSGLRPASAHAATPSVPIAVEPEAKPILADYRPPDRDQVRKAYLNVASVYRGEGLSGVVRQTIDCFDTLKQAPAYDMLDYCIALDAFGGALDHAVDHEQPQSDGYFASAGARDLDAAKAVVGSDGDAGARVVDVKRLAGEVSHDGPDAARKAIAALSGGAGPASAVEAAPGTGPHHSSTELRRPQTLSVAQADAPKQVAAAKAPPVKLALARPAPVKVAVAKPQPVKVQTVRAAASRPAPRLERHAAPKPFEHPRLQRASAPAKPHPKPVVTKASVKAHAKPAPHRPLRVAAKSPPKHEQPQVVRAAAHAWASLAHAVKTSLHPAKPTTVADRRSGEPAEWIDCRRPRNLSEERICEDIDSGGDGTLQGQVSRSKYEPSGRQ